MVGLSSTLGQEVYKAETHKGARGHSPQHHVSPTRLEMMGPPGYDTMKRELDTTPSRELDTTPCDGLDMTPWRAVARGGTSNPVGCKEASPHALMTSLRALACDIP